jgi:hypothetical protein
MLAIDLRRAHPVVSRETLYHGDVLPVQVTGDQFAAEDDFQVLLDLANPEPISNGRLRLEFDGQASEWMDAPITAYQVARAAEDLDISASFALDSVTLKFSDAVDEGDEPVLVHAIEGDLSGFVSRLSSTVFVVRWHLQSLALGEDPEFLDEATVDVVEAIEGDETTHRVDRATVDLHPFSGSVRCFLGEDSTDWLPWDASGYELRRAFRAAGIPGLVSGSLAQAAGIEYVHAEPGDVAGIEVEARLIGPVGFSDLLDLAEIRDKAALLGILPERLLLRVRANETTVFADMIESRGILSGSI